MCGRFVMACDLSDLVETFDISDIACEPIRDYNIAPGAQVAAVIHTGTTRLVPLKWGLVPSWSKDPSIGNRLINARAETVREKPSFRNAFKQRRCLIVATGFYEWKNDVRGKIPFYIGLRTDGPFGFAGLYDFWQSPEGNELATCTIITTEANDMIRPIHDRMPVIIPYHEVLRWLDPSAGEPAALLPLLKPYPSEQMTAYQVSSTVNSPRNNSPDCIKPALHSRNQHSLE
jgi:putative SOS response-associated peptidase YedK